MTHQNPNNTLEKEQQHSQAHLERLVMQKAVIKEIMAVSKAEQAALHRTLSNGDSHSVINAFGAKIGSISRSMPKPSAVVVDKAVVLPTFDIEDLEFYISQENAAEIIDVLNEHAPGLVSIRPKESALKRAEAAVISEWQKTGQTPEGWDVHLKDGVTSIRPNAIASEAAQELLNGITGIPEIEAGDHNDAV